MATANLTAERVRELLNYDPETGIFTRLCKVRGRYGAPSSVAGSSQHGYVRICIDRKLYWAHRLAWLYVHGQWPLHEIDHIDGDASNNRINNLRDVVRTTNCQNQRRARSTSKSGLLGVHYSEGKGVFVAQITANGKVTSLGSFSTAEEGHAAYLAAKRQLHEGCTI